MKLISLFFSLLIFTSLVVAQTDSVYIWPGSVPGEIKPKSPPVITTIEDGTTRVTEVTNPLYTVFVPQSAKKNNKAIVVCPGGGYVRLALHKEGFAVAEWLKEKGYTVFVLQYRVPSKRDGAVQDLQRALRMIRYQAGKYGIDPNKVGAIGFSAGAHLAARAAMADSLPPYPVQDAADALSGRPDCMIIIYPGYLSEGPNRSLTPELKASDKTVPAFIFQTMDDNSALSAFALGVALRNAKANVELHMLPEGGHGYGMYPGNKAAETWPGLLESWLREHF
jgi:acetyl esterase/lipase